MMTIDALTITIDGFAWSGREEVASLLAESLRLRLVGLEDVSASAELFDLDRAEVLERLERRQSLREQIGDLFERHMVIPGVMPFGGGAPWLMSAEMAKTLADARKPVASPVMMKSYLRSVLPEMVEEGAVVVGCGGQWVLRGAKSLLRVFLIAPTPVRVRRASVEKDISPQEAQSLVRQIDNNRKAFASQVFRGEWDSLQAYDLVINTGVLHDSEVANEIARLAKRMGGATLALEGVA